jgi:hypothetical protein
LEKTLVKSHVYVYKDRGAKLRISKTGDKRWWIG